MLLSLWWATIIWQNPHDFCMGQIGKLKENMLEITLCPLSLWGWHQPLQFLPVLVLLILFFFSWCRELNTLSDRFRPALHLKPALPKFHLNQGSWQHFWSPIASISSGYLSKTPQKVFYPRYHYPISDYKSFWVRVEEYLWHILEVNSQGSFSREPKLSPNLWALHLWTSSDLIITRSDLKSIFHCLL